MYRSGKQENEREDKIMAKEKEYKINIEPRILELLGPNLYTNIYYVLAELIANAYDAEAHNVYILSKEDRIIVEDDGNGMSYKDKDVAKYLNVAFESRRTKEDEITQKLKRKKMGRKGVGKLAALSVSNEVWVKTIKDKEKSGFILSRHIRDDHLLSSLEESIITFTYVKDHGTAIEMTNPEYNLPKSLKTLKKNLLKMFPLVDENFQIHLIRGKEEVIINDFEKEIIGQLGTLITLGKKFELLEENYKCDYPDSYESLVDIRGIKEIPVCMDDKLGNENEYTMKIEGWIGTYRSTKGRKRAVTDFPDNFISLYANKKMGEFNILPFVGQNKLNEVYVVGQLHIDLFEDTELPDMSLSNRQGYKTDDMRYVLFTEYVREKLLPDVLKLRENYAGLKKKDSETKKWNERKRKEEELKRNVKKFKEHTSKSVADKISKNTDIKDYEIVKKIVEAEIENGSSQLGLKTEVDSQKKKILISHTKKDKDFADIIYNMLVYNGVPNKDILYTNCDDEAARIPDEIEIYEYLRSFFVDSISTQKIYVIYVTSQDMGKSWGAVSEVGAGWITQVNHEIFNIGSFKPGHPLDDARQWLQVKRAEGEIYVDNVNYDVFCVKIEAICKSLGYSCQNRADNKLKLSQYVNVLKSDVFNSL